MDEKDPSTDLPPEIACIHRKWNVRSVAYKTLVSHFQKLHPSSEEWGAYRNVICNIAGESFPTIREQALETVFHYVQRCDAAEKTSIEVIHTLLDTIPANIRARSKNLLEKIILQYVEIGCARDAIDELLRTALISPVANVATNCIQIITKILSVFGPAAIDLPYVLETLPYLQEVEESEFRSAIKVLILEVYRWQGKDSIKNVNQILNPADLKEVKTKYEATNQTGPLKPTRHVRNNKGICLSQNGASSSDLEKDVLKHINEDFFRKLESTEWTERRDALTELKKLLENSYKLRPGNYDPLLFALKKVIIEDQCVIVVGLAIVAITEIAQGLRQQFSPYAVGICRILLEKFVEKRQNITEQLRKALDVLSTTTSFESLIKTINSFLFHKNPTIRFETIQLVCRLFKKSSRQTLRKPEFGCLYKSLVNSFQHGQLIIREKSFLALAIVYKVAGEGVIMPYLRNIEPVNIMKIKDYTIDDDFEEKYNAIKYRNVAKKELKQEEKLKKEISMESQFKGSEKVDSEVIDFSSTTLGNLKVEVENVSRMQSRQRMKSIERIENHQIYNCNKVTKRWSSSNSNVTMEKYYIKQSSEEPVSSIFDINSLVLQKRQRRKEKLKKQRRSFITKTATNEKRKQKRMNKYQHFFDHQAKDVVAASDQIEENIIISINNLSNDPTNINNLPNDLININSPPNDAENINNPSNNSTNTNNLSNTPTKLEPEVTYNNIQLAENPVLSDISKKSVIKSIKSQIKPPSIETKASNTLIINPKKEFSAFIKEKIKLENTTSEITQGISEVSHQIQQSVQTLELAKSGEGFIVLTENEVKKLLGLKKISGSSEDSCSILNDWASKRNLVKRSYKIFQVSKGATDRETQTCSVEESMTTGITPECGVIDLTKTVRAIPTQTAGVSIEERGTDARYIKRYNRGTQCMHAQPELESMLRSKQECKDIVPVRVNRSQQTSTEIPLKTKPAALKKIEYRAPTLKGDRQLTESDTLQTRSSDSRVHPISTNKRIMEINTLTVTRSNPMEVTKSTSESQTSEDFGNLKRNQGITLKQKTTFTKLNNSVEMLKNARSKRVKEIKKQCTGEITMHSKKETTEKGRKDMDHERMIRLKKIERCKHHSLSRAREASGKGRPPVVKCLHRSELSIRTVYRKGRPSNLNKKKSKFKHKKPIETSSHSHEGCNFLPFVTKSIVGHNNEPNQLKNKNGQKNQQRQKSQQPLKKGTKTNNGDNNQKEEKALKKKNTRRGHPGGDKEASLNYMKDACSMDQETKQMMIKELLRVCDISQNTFQKMVRRKVHPRPCILTTKPPMRRVNKSPIQNSSESATNRTSKDNKSCTIM